MRTYPQQPDEATLQALFDRVRAPQRRLGPDRTGQHVVVTAAERARDALALGWALEVDLGEVRDLVRPAVETWRAALDAQVDLDHEALATVLPTALVVGDRDATVTLARRASGRSPRAVPDDTTDVATGMLAALALDQAEAAGDLADTLATHDERVATPPDLAAQVVGLSAMAHALLDPARNGWLDAATARAEHVVAHHQRTDARRHASTGLVDLGGTALCRLALVAGMPLPDHPVFAAGLLRGL